MMVGRDVASSHEWTSREAGAELLLVVDLHGRDAAGVERLSGVSFSVRAGEVFAIAGVDGNGQAELAEAIGGLVPPAGGHVYVDGADLTAGGIGARLDAGMAHIPADPRVHRPRRRHDDCREHRATRLRPGAVPTRDVARHRDDPPGGARPGRALRRPSGRRGRAGAHAVRR
jgi:energy-coupling factor transporter ATP-binding protein EcfA2